MKAPRSVLPKALRRGGKRPLKLAWPARPARVHEHRTKRELAAHHRHLNRLQLRLARRPAS